MSEKCCGNCMNHVPTDRFVSSKEHAYRGHGDYWICRRNRKAKRCEHGKKCSHFEDRYEKDSRVLEWIGKVHEERDKKNQR